LIAQELGAAEGPAERAWVAVNLEDRPTRLRLETPAGVLTAERWGVGRIEWRTTRDGTSRILVDCAEPPIGLSAPSGAEVANEESR
jgi:hypothetical protein